MGNDMNSVLFAFQQQCEKCVQASNRFLEIVVNSEEMKNTIIELKNSLAQKYTEEGNNGESLMNWLFPHTEELISVDENLGIPITYVTLGDAEYESLQALHQQFLASFSQQIAPLLGIPTVEVTDEQGNKFKIAPILQDYTMFKQALLNMSMNVFFSAKVEEFKKKNSSIIQTATTPMGTAKLLKG